MNREIFKSRRTGFTLSELLIALAILGVLATFTIPKVLQSQQDTKFKSIGKETAATISAAYEAYKLQNSTSSGTKASDLTQYMNYVSRDTVSTIDQNQGAGATIDCSGVLCIRLHNGAILHTSNVITFGGTGSTNAVYFLSIRMAG